MSLYEQILREAEEAGIEYPPPSSGIRRRDPNGELEALRGLTLISPTSPWSGMRFASLKRRHPREYERFLLEKGGGHWMFGFGDGEDRGSRYQER